MGFTSYFSASPFDGDVEKATNENNTSEDWGLIMDICDKVGTSPQKAKECLRSIIKRLHNMDPHIVVQAVTLLDACVSNCGKTFQLEVASREFETEMKKVVKKWPAPSGVGAKLRTLVKKWSDAEFKNDPQLSLLTSMYSRMKSDGIDVTIHTDPTSNKNSRPVDPDTVASQQEVDDIAKAIELSLKESSSPKSAPASNSYGSISGSSSLYPSIGGPTLGSSSTSGSSSSEPRKVRALYDFEAAEENELTFFAGEIIHVLDDSDANWWRGCNQRGEGLFPNNFVTPDLSADPTKLNKNEKKGVQFNETVEVKSVARARATEIDPEKIDRVLHLLHEADPNVDTHDPPELLPLEEEVMEMSPLIDNELEKVDRKHAQLSQLSGSLVEAMNMYHSLLREPVGMMGKGHMPPMGPGMYHTLPGHGGPHHGPPGPSGPHSLPGLPPQMGIPHGILPPGQPVPPGVFSPPGGHPPVHPGPPPQPHEFPMYQSLPPHSHNMYQNGPPSHYYPPPPN